MSNKDYEIVQAYKTHDILGHKNILKEGITPIKYKDLLKILYNCEQVHWQRNRLEDNPQYQQLIPYVVVKHKDQYLVYERLQCGEKRLLNMVSIGVGGHINLEDDTLIKGAYRELREELKFSKGMTFKLFEKLVKVKGTVKTWVDDVGSVHLGVFMMLDLSDYDFKITSSDPKEMAVYWVKKEDMIAGMDRMERWAKYITEYLFNEKTAG